MNANAKVLKAEQLMQVEKNAADTMHTKLVLLESDKRQIQKMLQKDAPSIYRKLRDDVFMGTEMERERVRVGVAKM